MRDYSNTGEVQGAGSYRFLRINGKDGILNLQFNGEKKVLGSFAGYLDGFKFYEDPGNPEYNIKPHKGISIFMSAVCPFTGEQGAKFKFDQSLNNAVIGPTIMNSLLGEEDRLTTNSCLTISAWLKNEYARCKLEVDGSRAENKFPYAEELRWFEGVPKPKDGINPADDSPIKIWKEVYQFWYDQAEQFVHRMATKLTGEEPKEAPAKEEATAAPAKETVAKEHAPEPAPEAETMSQLELTGKLAQVEKLKTEAHLKTAYENLSKYNLSEGQLRMADGKFTMVAGKLNLGLIFSEGKIASSPLLKNDDSSDDLPF